MFDHHRGMASLLRRSAAVAATALLLVACQGPGAATSPTGVATSAALASPTATAAAAESPEGLAGCRVAYSVAAGRVADGFPRVRLAEPGTARSV